MTNGKNTENAIYTISISDESGKIRSLLEILKSRKNYNTLDMIINLLSKVDPSSNDGLLLKTELPKLIIETENKDVGKMALELLEKISNFEKKDEPKSLLSSLLSIHKKGNLESLRYLAFLMYVKKGYFSEFDYKESFPKEKK
jgi:hypothetical protein